MLLAPLMRPVKLMIPPLPGGSQDLPPLPPLCNHGNPPRVFKTPRLEPTGSKLPVESTWKSRKRRQGGDQQGCVAFKEPRDKALSTFPFIFTMFPYYPRHVAVLTETIKKGIHDADSEARSIARK